MATWNWILSSILYSTSSIQSYCVELPLLLCFNGFFFSTASLHIELRGPLGALLLQLFGVFAWVGCMTCRGTWTFWTTAAKMHLFNCMQRCCWGGWQLFRRAIRISRSSRGWPPTSSSGHEDKERRRGMTLMFVVICAPSVTHADLWTLSNFLLAFYTVVELGTFTHQFLSHCLTFESISVWNQLRLLKVLVHPQKK